MAVYYQGPEEKPKVKVLATTLVIVVILMLVFFVVVPNLFGERCSLSSPDPVYVPEGVTQVIGPTLTETCEPPVIILTQSQGVVLFWAWWSLLPISLLVLVIGMIIHLKTEA